jgi:hypothetical protein
MVQPGVNGDAIAEVVADWTCVPVGRMVKNDLTTLLEFEQTLSQRIVGQESTDFTRWKRGALCRQNRHQRSLH